MNKDEYRYTDTLFKRSQLASPETGEGFAAKVRAVVADHSRQLQGTLSKAKQAQGRPTQGMAGKKRTWLPGGVLVETWINPFGLVPTLVARVVFPETGEEEEEPEKTYGTGFIFAPTSLDALYSWGVPYEDSGIPINPPLGTVLLSTNYNTAPPKKQYRNVSEETGSWVVTHDQDKLGGRLWKRKGGRMLSWGPVAGFGHYLPSDKQSGPIYYRGNWLAGYPDVANAETHQILAVNYTGNTLFALVKATGSSSLFIAKKEVNWETETASGPWSISTSFVLPGGYSATALYSNGLVDINNSCNQAVVTTWASDITYVRKTAEIDISWDDALTVETIIVSESIDSIEQPLGEFVGWVGSGSTTPLPGGLTNENWYGCTAPTVSNSQGASSIDWSGSCEAVLSARYVEDSDDKTRITIKLEHSVDGSASYNTSWTWTEDEFGWFMLTAITSVSNSIEERRTTVSLLVDGGSVYSEQIYYWRSESSENTALSWAMTNNTPGSASGGYQSSLDEKTHRIAIPVALAEARQGGFVAWRCRTGLIDSGSSDTLTGMVNNPDDPGSECEVLSTTSGYNNDSTDQIFEYVWDSADIGRQTHSYTYTTPFVSGGSSSVWASNTSELPYDLYRIMWARGGMDISDTDGSAALWAPGLALVQNWVRPTTGSDLRPLSLPYWSGGDLLELASAQGDNQAISPREWSSAWGIIS